jgi:hypothetical protein
MRRLLRITALALPFVVSPAAQAQVYGDNASLMDYWYRTYLGRAPDNAAAGWIMQLNQGVPADRVQAPILGSDEYYARAGGTPQGFIRLLYSDLLKRAPSPAELDLWVRRLYTEDRTRIADEILTQNPGVWVGISAAAPPPVTVTPPAVVSPGIDWGWHRDWDRDRHREWNWHHDIHEYRRPDFHNHREEHHRDHH